MAETASSPGYLGCVVPGPEGAEARALIGGRLGDIAAPSQEGLSRMERPKDRDDELRVRRNAGFLFIPEHRFVMVDGSGPPGGEAFEARMPGLYGVAYALRFALKRRGVSGRLGRSRGSGGTPPALPIWTRSSPMTGRVNNSREDPEGVVRDLTAGLGADVTIEAVGVPETFELCTRLVRPGGHVANVGVHGKPATLHLEDLWIKDVTITTGLVDAYSTPTLLSLIRSGQLDTGRFVTHRFAMNEFMDAYDVFSRASETGALKVVLTPS